MAGSWPRRLFLANTVRGVAGLALAPRVEAVPAFDLVLKGGTILDGTGGPPWVADVGIVGDSIAGVGEIAREQARRCLEVGGLHVAPGFIDIHSHSDGDILAYPTADSRVQQGVTTEVTGNCGSSAAPLLGPGAEERRRGWKEDEGVEADWSDVASYCRRVEEERASVNQALLLGQGTLRAAAVGLADRPLAPDELKTVLRAVEEGMDQGAFGLSTGLEYTPGRYTPAPEIQEMARIVARRGGLYASHIRNEEAMLLEAVNEALEVGRHTGVRVEISHLKAAGRRNWDKQSAALDLIEAARAGGVDVLADAYPYTAYSTGLTIFLEDWALEGGTAPMLERLRDAADRARIRKGAAARVAADPGDYDAVVVSRVRSASNQPVVGRSLAAIAELRGVEPAEALLRLIEDEEGVVSFIGHAMSPANVERVLAHPLVIVGSDGRAMAPRGRAAQSRPHPRSYGAFARVLDHYVRERRLLDLSTAVRKMTSLPAAQVGLVDRGLVARGMKADLTVFDADGIRDHARFEDPHRHPDGMKWVIVGGVPVVEGGRHTGARPGRMLRKG